MKGIIEILQEWDEQKNANDYRTKMEAENPENEYFNEMYFYTELCKCIDDKAKCMLDSFLITYNKKHEQESTMYYKLGLKTGFTLANELRDLHE